MACVACDDDLNCRLARAMIKSHETASMNGFYEEGSERKEKMNETIREFGQKMAEIVAEDH